MRTEETFVEAARRLVPQMSADEITELMGYDINYANSRLKGMDATYKIYDYKLGKSIPCTQADRDAFVIERLEKAQDKEHYKVNLEKYDSKSWNAGRCYNKGTHKVRRKDGEPLGELDIRAIKSIRYGQGHGVTVDESGMFASVSWSCDSSD